MRRAVTARSLQRIVAAEGFRVDTRFYPPGEIAEMRRPLVRAAWQTATTAARLMTIGMFKGEYPDLLIVAWREWQGARRMIPSPARGLLGQRKLSRLRVLGEKSSHVAFEADPTDSPSTLARRSSPPTPLDALARRQSH